jgi:hypothetical protein
MCARRRGVALARIVARRRSVNGAQRRESKGPQGQDVELAEGGDGVAVQRCGVMR